MNVEMTVAQVREHARAHRSDDCDLCELWRKYLSPVAGALDDDIDVELPRDTWGEANWTAKELH